MNQDQSRLAAVESVLPRIEAGMTIGLGSGRAVFALADAIGQRFNGKAPIKAVVASPETQTRCETNGIEVIDLRAETIVDVAIDGADEIDARLNMIKGGGAALLREKLLITAARHVVIIAESSKLVDRLGATRLLPAEVVKFGWEKTQQRVEALVGTTVVRRMETDGTPVIAAEGNYLLDFQLPEVNLHAFATELKSLLGVVDHGLFLGLANEAILGNTDGTISTMQL